MSEDIVTQEGLIKKTFDPFEETTLIEMDRYESFGYGSATIQVSVAKVDSKKGEQFLLRFKAGGSGGDNRHVYGSAVMEKVIIACDDVTNINLNIDYGGSPSTSNRVSDKGDITYYADNTGQADISLKQLKTICEANNIEARYYGGIGYLDTKDGFEAKLKRVCRVFYSNVVEPGAYDSDVKQLHTTVGREKLIKLILWVLLGVGILWVLSKCAG